MQSGGHAHDKRFISRVAVGAESPRVQEICELEQRTIASHCTVLAVAACATLGQAATCHASCQVGRALQVTGNDSSRQQPAITLEHCRIGAAHTSFPQLLAGEPALQGLRFMTLSAAGNARVLPSRRSVASSRGLAESVPRWRSIESHPTRPVERSSQSALAVRAEFEYLAPRIGSCKITNRKSQPKVLQVPPTEVSQKICKERRTRNTSRGKVVMQDQPSEYAGPERRRRVVYFTRNTEYHFLDAVCVAVRRRDTGQWRMAHVVLQRPLSGSVRFTVAGEVHPKADPPEVGDALFFETEAADVITSVLTAVGRPLPQTISAYPI
jgi:hypothetical protein